MKRHLLIIAYLISAVTLFAENKTFIRTYNYQASESDSKITARSKAINEVKRLLLEELGVYMESYTNYIVEDKNGAITKDFFQNEIKSLSAGVTETKILEENWNGIEYFVKAEIIADPTDVARKINATLEKRQADVVIDSLRTLLSNTQTISVQKNAEIDSLQAKYNAQNAQVQKQTQKVNELTAQLATLKKQLAASQQQEQQMLSEVQKIQQIIQNKTDIVLKNARIGMTKDELIRVCGQPRSEHYDYLNYGKIWIKLSGYDENAIVVKGARCTNWINVGSSNNILKE